MNNQQLQQQMAGMNPETQATLGKYGIQQNSGFTPKISQDKIVVNNTTYTTTHNNVKVSQLASGPVISQPNIQMRSNSGQNSVAKFKTWMSNAFARQREESLARDKEYKRKEWSLSRSASKMMRGVERLGKNVLEKLDPRNLNTSKISSLQMLSWLMTIGMVAKFWPKIIDLVGKVVVWLKGVAHWMGFSRNGWKWEGSGLKNFLGNIFGDVNNPTQGLINFGLGVIDDLLGGIKGWFNEMGERIRELPIPKLPRLTEGVLAGTLNQMLGYMETAMLFGKNLLVSMISDHKLKNLQAGETLDDQTLLSITQNFPIGDSTKHKKGVWNEYSGSVNKENAVQFNDTASVYIRNKDGNLELKKGVGKGDRAALEHTGAERMDMLIPTDINDHGYLGDALGASARMSSAMVTGASDPSRFNYFIAGMKLFEELRNRASKILVVDEFVNALKTYYGINPDEYFTREKTKTVLVDQNEYNRYRHMQHASLLGGRGGWESNWFNGTMGALAESIGAASWLNPNNVKYNQDFKKEVLVEVPLDAKIGQDTYDSNGNLLTSTHYFLKSDKFNDLSNTILNKIGIQEGEGRFWSNSNVDLTTRMTQYLFRNGENYKDRYKAHIPAAGSVNRANLKAGLLSNKDVIEAYYLDRYGVSPYYHSINEYVAAHPGIDFPTAMLEYGKLKNGFDSSRLIGFPMYGYTPPSGLSYLQLESDQKALDKYVDKYVIYNMALQGYPNSYTLPTNKTVDISGYRNGQLSSEEIRKKEQEWDEQGYREITPKTSLATKQEIIASSAEKAYQEWETGQVTPVSGVGSRSSGGGGPQGLSGNLWKLAVEEAYSIVQEHYNTHSGAANDNMYIDASTHNVPYSGNYNVQCSGTVRLAIMIFWELLKKNNSPGFDEDAYNNYIKTGKLTASTATYSKESYKSTMEPLGFKYITYSASSVQPWDIMVADQNQPGAGTKHGHAQIVGDLLSNGKYRKYSATTGAPKGFNVFREMNLSDGCSSKRSWNTIWRLNSNFSSLTGESNSSDSETPRTVEGLSGQTFYKPTAVGNINNRDFGLKFHPIKKVWKPHRGVDISGTGSGADVYAIKDGTVIFAGRKGDYGNLIEIDHGNGFTTRYAHLLDGGVLVKKGDTVTGGQLIGKVGSTGGSTGPHLHFETRVNGEAVDPSQVLHSSFKAGGGYKDLGQTATADGNYTLPSSKSENKENKEDDNEEGGSFFNTGFVGELVEMISSFFDGIKKGFDYLVDLDTAYRQQQQEWKEVKDPQKLIDHWSKESGENLRSMVGLGSKGNIAKRLTELDPDYAYNIKYSDSEPGKFTLYRKRKDGTIEEDAIEEEPGGDEVSLEDAATSDISTEEEQPTTKEDINIEEETGTEEQQPGEWKEISTDDFGEIYGRLKEKHPQVGDWKVNVVDAAPLMSEVDPDYDYRAEYKDGKFTFYRREKARPLVDDPELEALRRQKEGEEFSESDTENVNIPLEQEEPKEDSDWEYIKNEDVSNLIRSLLSRGDIPEEDKEKLRKGNLVASALANLLSKYDPEFNYSVEASGSGELYNNRDKWVWKRKPKIIDGPESFSANELISEANDYLRGQLLSTLGIRNVEEIEEMKPDLFGLSSSPDSMSLADNILEGGDPSAKMIDITRAGVKKVNNEIASIERTIDYLQEVAIRTGNVVVNQTAGKTGGKVITQSYTSTSMA